MVINFAIMRRDQEGNFMRIVLMLGTLFLLSGCVTSLVKEVVTAPIKIVSKTADVLTTSQSESDEKRGKEMRKREEALGKLARQRDKAREKCEDGDDDACKRARSLEDEIAAEQDRVS
jgi:predicted Holliday junction resolvase-like endonuclease